jgi:hypothetical protein
MHLSPILGLLFGSASSADILEKRAITFGNNRYYYSSFNPSGIFATQPVTIQCFLTNQG